LNECFKWWNTNCVNMGPTWKSYTKVGLVVAMVNNGTPIQLIKFTCVLFTILPFVWLWSWTSNQMLLQKIFFWSNFLIKNTQNNKCQKDHLVNLDLPLWPRWFFWMVKQEVIWWINNGSFDYLDSYLNLNLFLDYYLNYISFR
jgi:hypothetical protein